MKKKIFKTIWLVLLAIIAKGIIGVANYFVKMEYASSIAPAQLEDSAVAYQMIHAKDSVDNIIWLANLIVIGLIIFVIVRVWTKKDKQEIESI